MIIVEGEGEGEIKERSVFFVKKAKRILFLFITIVFVSSMISMGALAASTSTYVSFTGVSGTYYYAAYNNSYYYVGYGWPNHTNQVKMVQAYCYQAGTLSPISEIDGVYGSKTNAAIYNYQYKYGLTADGGVGAETWKDMGYIHFGTSIASLL